MAKLTISDAARVTGVSRMLLYRYIKAGKLSRTPDGFLDTAELLRAGLLLQHSDVTPPVTMLHEVTPTHDTLVTPVTAPVTPSVTAETRTLERLIDVLQRELDAARERETLLLQMLAQMQQQNQRLLDMPHPAPTPTMLPGHPPPAAPPPRQARDATDRGDMRRRIVALLQEHPAGLSPAQIRGHLGVEKRLAHTLIAMMRDGLVRRVAPGRYVACEAHHDEEGTG